MANKYSQVKVLHFTEKVNSLPRETSEILPPIHVRIKPTNACNHRCRYCAYLDPDMQLGQDMLTQDSIPQGKMNEIIDDFIDMGVKAVTFSGGGEPLIYPHLFEILTKLEQSPIKFATLTNGALLKGELADILSRSGTWVRISMDGWDDESYKKYRGVGDGEYTKIMNNLQAFHALGGSCTLGVSLIIDRENGMYVYDMIRRLQEAGVSSVKASPCIVSNEGAASNNYHKPVYERIKGEIARAIEDFSCDDFEIFDSYHLLDEKFDKNYSWCPYLQVLTVVAADQNVYSCQDKAYNLECGCLGSIKDQRFKDFWMQGKEKFFGINPGCDCNHHCVAASKNQLIHDYLNADPEHLEFV